MSTITLRPFLGPSDYQTITDLINAGFAAAEFPAVESLGETENTFAHLENCDPVRDVRIAEDDAGNPLGYARLTRWAMPACTGSMTRRVCVGTS